MEGPSQNQVVRTGCRVEKESRITQNPVQEKFVNLPDESMMSAAPHTIALCGDVYIAVNRYCVAEGCVREAKKHEITFPGISSLELPNDIEQKLCQLINCLQPKNKYNITISEPLDCHGRFAHITVAVAVCLLIVSLEKQKKSAIDIQKLCSDFLKENDVRMNSPKAVMQAVFQGSTENVHLSFEGKNDTVFGKRTVTVKKFDAKYDLVFARTSLHTGDFMPKVCPQWYTRDDLSNKFTDNWGIEEIPTQMMVHSDTVMRDTRFMCLDIETESEAAFKSAFERDQTNMHGYEVQQGGCLMAMAKNAFNRNKFFHSLSNIIGMKFGAPKDGFPSKKVTWVQFVKLGLGVGATIVDDENYQSFPPSAKLEMTTIVHETKPKVEAVLAPVDEGDGCSDSDADWDDEDVCAAAEPKRKRAKDDHDDTYDSDSSFNSSHYNPSSQHRFYGRQ